MVTQSKHIKAKRLPSALNSITAIERVHKAIVKLEVEFLRQPPPTGTAKTPEIKVPVRAAQPAESEPNEVQEAQQTPQKGNRFFSRFQSHKKPPQVPAVSSLPARAKAVAHHPAAAKNGEETSEAASKCKYGLGRDKDLVDVWEPPPNEQPTTSTAKAATPEVSDDSKTLLQSQKDLARHLTQLRNKFVWATAFVEEFRRIYDQDTAKHEYRVNAAFAGISAITSIVGAAKP
jgi:hypothetical protein